MAGCCTDVGVMERRDNTNERVITGEHAERDTNTDTDNTTPLEDDIRAELILSSVATTCHLNMNKH